MIRAVIEILLNDPKCEKNIESLAKKCEWLKENKPETYKVERVKNLECLKELKNNGNLDENKMKNVEKLVQIWE